MENTLLPIIFWPTASPFVKGSKYCTVLKKQKTCAVFLSSYRNTTRSLGEREMLWEQEPQASVSTALSSSPRLS